MANISPDELTTDDVAEGDTIEIRFHSNHYRMIVTRKFDVVEVSSDYEGNVEEMRVRYHSTGKVYRLINADGGAIMNHDARGELYELGTVHDYPLEDDESEEEQTEQTELVEQTGDVAAIADGGEDKSDMYNAEPEVDDQDEIDAEAARELVAQELADLLKRGLSPSQALDYWATQNSTETHGEYTQTDWSEIRDRSQQAISDSVTKAQAQLDETTENISNSDPSEIGGKEEP